jgi:hypothetical protein
MQMEAKDESSIVESMIWERNARLQLNRLNPPDSRPLLYPLTTQLKAAEKLFAKSKYFQLLLYKTIRSSCVPLFVASLSCMLDNRRF